MYEFESLQISDVKNKSLISTITKSQYLFCHDSNYCNLNGMIQKRFAVRFHSLHHPPTFPSSVTMSSIIRATPENRGMGSKHHRDSTYKHTANIAHLLACHVPCFSIHRSDSATCKLTLRSTGCVRYTCAV